MGLGLGVGLGLHYPNPTPHYITQYYVEQSTVTTVVDFRSNIPFEHLML